MKKTFKGAFGNPVKSVLDPPSNIYSACGFNLETKSDFQVRSEGKTFKKHSNFTFILILGDYT
jgi:hypothetical protein